MIGWQVEGHSAPLSAEEVKSHEGSRVLRRRDFLNLRALIFGRHIETRKQEECVLKVERAVISSMKVRDDAGLGGFRLDDLPAAVDFGRRPHCFHKIPV